MLDDAEAPEIDPHYRDPRQPATAEPGRIPPALQEFAAAAVQRLVADPRSLARSLGVRRTRGGKDLRCPVSPGPETREPAMNQPRESHAPRFHQALRSAFVHAADVGAREIWLSDPDFAAWPLDEPTCSRT